MIKNLYELQDLFNQEFQNEEIIISEKEYIEGLLADKNSGLYEDMEDKAEREQLSRLRVEYFQTDLVIDDRYERYPVYRFCYHLLEGDEVVYYYEIEYLNGEFVDEYMTKKEH